MNNKQGVNPLKKNCSTFTQPKELSQIQKKSVKYFVQVQKRKANCYTVQLAVRENEGETTCIKKISTCLIYYIQYQKNGGTRKQELS